MEQKQHWESVYRAKAPDVVSWYEPRPQESLNAIRLLDLAPSDAILDVGGGASTLVDALLAEGFLDVTVLDLSATALDVTRRRLGESAASVRWIEGDVLQAPLPASHFAVWHDRAVFHFLTAEPDQRRYAGRMHHALRPGGHVVMATFAEDGPTRCSGLEVRRHSPDSLRAAFGGGFTLLHSRRTIHRTPAGQQQAFLYCLFRKQ